MLKKEIIVTKDGSHTITIPQLNVTYHSVHGAIQESKHVFIEAGLRYLINQLSNQPINLFEMGFGTGLNAFLTAIEAGKMGTIIHYTAVETSPLSLSEASGLNYSDLLGHPDLFQQLHGCRWNEEMTLTNFFSITKLQASLLNLSTDKRFNLIYYDAFAPLAQPELWTKEIFEKLFSMLNKNGLLVTYCSKGDVRRAMKAAGFKVEKLPGPPGKWEMVRASKSGENLYDDWTDDEWNQLSTFYNKD